MAITSLHASAAISDRSTAASIQGFAELLRPGAEGDRVQLEVIFRRIEDKSAQQEQILDEGLHALSEHGAPTSSTWDSPGAPGQTGSTN